MHLHGMQNRFRHKYKKVVYTFETLAGEFMKTTSDEVKLLAKFLYKPKNKLSSNLLGIDSFAKVQYIRTSES